MYTDNAPYSLEVVIPGPGLVIWEATGYLEYRGNASTSSIEAYAYLAPTSGFTSTQLWGMAATRATGKCKGNCNQSETFIIRQVVKVEQGDVSPGTHCQVFPCTLSWDVRASTYGWGGNGKLYLNLLSATFYPDCHYPAMVRDTNY